MPKSKRSKTFHLTQVQKHGREHKDTLFSHIRECIPQYHHCFVFSVDNMRNNHLKDVRRDLRDSRLFFGKTKLTARALGTTPEEASAEGLDRLAAHVRGAVGLLFTNRPPPAVEAYFAGLTAADFARAGAVAPRTVVVPRGVVYSTGSAVPEADDVPLAATLEPELRRLGMPVRLVRGRVVLDGVAEDGTAQEVGYTVCREGEVLDARQTRLLKLFSVCLSEFRVRLLAYWTAATGEVTELDPNAMDVEAEATSGNEDEEGGEE